MINVLFFSPQKIGNFFFAYKIWRSEVPTPPPPSLVKGLIQCFDGSHVSVQRHDVIGIKLFRTYLFHVEQANSGNCGSPPGNNFDLEVGQGHCMVPIERACHKDHACQISMLYH